MNLEDLINPEFGLRHDDFVGTKFGNDNQLEVVGWSHRDTFLVKYYIVKCSICSNDNEMFGDGFFKTKKSSLVAGKVPCGCAKSQLWSQEQWKVKAQRKAKELGYEFVDFVGEWKGAHTNVKLFCKQHGEWDSGILNNLIHSDHGCPKCKADITRERSVKPDPEIIASFFSTGAFHPDTKFWRSDRTNHQGWKPYWNVYCPECQSTSESFIGNLRKGKRPCLCSKARQRQAYINVIKDGDSTIAIKFGIANNSYDRVKQQDASSTYTVENHMIFEFPTKEQCLTAERTCMSEVSGPVLSKTEMPDGWTETTYPYNLDKIVEIYEEYGGVRVQ